MNSTALFLAAVAVLTALLIPLCLYLDNRAGVECVAAGGWWEYTGPARTWICHPIDDLRWGKRSHD